MRMKTSRQLKAEETQKRIVLCYLDMIRERPADKVKISELCQRANVSVGTYYYYYKNKDSIVRAIYSHIDDRFNEIYRTLRAGSYVGKILEYITHTGDEAQDYFGLRAATTIYQIQMDVEGSFFSDITRPFGQNLCRLLEDAIEAGELPSGTDIRSAVLDLLCIFRGIVYSWCLLEGEFDVKETIHTVVSSYMDDLVRTAPAV